ncbi:LOW QUALITY PROTEIN: hypothetical protein M9H77_11706 [Catharanthus roseus]|uniref:Uncharacterized protein n=1 Tax=Catharanthus roseus TaxID=4058 RepID=A0ACC0BFE3_CATRO|nr:LOW QUALITY PROTEIN: hypothetical protein M9H77_11706 [Catharanthus roseus]
MAMKLFTWNMVMLLYDSIQKSITSMYWKKNHGSSWATTSTEVITSTLAWIRPPKILVELFHEELLIQKENKVGKAVKIDQTKLSRTRANNQKEQSKTTITRQLLIQPVTVRADADPSAEKDTVENPYRPWILARKFCRNLNQYTNKFQQFRQSGGAKPQGGTNHEVEKRQHSHSSEFSGKSQGAKKVAVEPRNQEKDTSIDNSRKVIINKIQAINCPETYTIYYSLAHAQKEPNHQKKVGKSKNPMGQETPVQKESKISSQPGLKLWSFVNPKRKSPTQTGVQTNNIITTQGKLNKSQGVQQSGIVVLDNHKSRLPGRMEMEVPLVDADLTDPLEQGVLIPEDANMLTAESEMAIRRENSRNFDSHMEDAM